MEAPAIRRRGAEDHISGLPDELLHIILLRLPSAAAAARTSVLSRRWRGVWSHMPELVLGGSPAPATPPSALLDSIDAALNSYAAPTLHSLKIELSGIDRCDVHANRIASWLGFASQRLAAKVHLRVRLENDAARRYGVDVEPQLALPICERATEIDIDLGIGYLTDFFLRPPPTGSFSALTNLEIACNRVDGGELGRLVSSTQCPCLRTLYVFVLEFEPTRDISISSESLERFSYSARETGKLEVNAPMLKDIGVSRSAEACIAAPKLENVKWFVPYDPRCHQFVVAGRHLQSLSIVVHSTCYSIPMSSTRLMERFDTVSELKLSLSIGEGIAGYTTFLKETEKLPICQTLVVTMPNDHGHAFAPMMVHLLRRCICIRKFKLFLVMCTPCEMPSCTTLNCPCLLPENYRLDDITFDSLEEIGISSFSGSAEQEEFVELLLSRCNTMTLKRVDFTMPSGPVSSEIMEVVQRIRSMCHPNSKVQFNMHPREVQKS